MVGVERLRLILLVKVGRGGEEDEERESGAEQTVISFHFNQSYQKLSIT